MSPAAHEVLGTVYVFGYGSLVDRGSLEASVGHVVDVADGPFPAHLHGYRRSWNVATPTSVRPDFRFVTADGGPWNGMLGWLGIARDDEAVAPGAMYRVAESDLAVLDRREASYDRIEVSAAIDADPPVAGGEAVFTYRPSAGAVARALADAERTTVMARYLRLLERGFRALGDTAYNEHVRTLPDPAPFTVAEIFGSPRDASAPNPAVDPARD